MGKIDGVDALNNILLIGMTNRKDLIDDALLRPGRLEVHVEISLPDEDGRVQILNIQTKNFSGAELEGLIKSASSFALNRKVSIIDLAKSKDMGAVMLTNEDFEHALEEVKPM